MKKLLAIVVLGLLLSGNAYADDGKAVSYGGVNEMPEKARENSWPLKVEWGLIGSCTNSSYEDLSRAASLAKQAKDKSLKAKSEFTITLAKRSCDFTTFTVEKKSSIIKTLCIYLINYKIKYINGDFFFIFQFKFLN